MWKPLLLAGALVALVSGSASARDHWHDRGGHGGWHDRGWHDHGWHGGSRYYGRPFVDFDVELWRGGYWDHGWRSGRFGWWWSVGPGYYYYYARPVYPYPDPYETTVVVQPQPMASGAPSQQQSWYYCDKPKGYYPYVSECSVDWRPVPVTPPSNQ